MSLAGLRCNGIKKERKRKGFNKYCKLDPTSPTNSNKLDYPPGPPWKMLDPTLEPWKISFLRNKPLDFCKINEEKKR